MDIVNRNIGDIGGRNGSIRFYGLGDVHLGARASDRAALKAGVAHIRSDGHGWWYGGGDFFDAILVGDKRFDMRMENALDQRLWREAGRDYGIYQDVCVDALLDILWPILPRCLGLGTGNHEDTPAQRGQANLLESFVRAYRRQCRVTNTKPNPWVRVMNYNTVLLLQFCRARNVRSEVVVFVTHGAGAATTVGGRMNRLESVLSWFPHGDLYVCFHYHDKAAHPRVRFDIIHGENPRILQRECRCMLVPSFHRTYMAKVDNYGAKRLYPPSVLGLGVAEIWPSGERIRHRGFDTDRPRIEVRV